MICEKKLSQSLSREERAERCLWCTVLLGARPAGKHEADLVDKIGNVIDHVEGDLVGHAGQEAEEVARRVDAPARADDDAHVFERVVHWTSSVRGGFSGITGKDLEEDEAPAAQAQDES